MTNSHLTHQKDYFNHLGISYQLANKVNIATLERVKRITSEHVKGEVLEVGSGGVVGFDYTKANKIILSDLAKDSINEPHVVWRNKLVPLKSKKVLVRLANVLQLPFRKNQFDTVFMLNVAHHLSVSNLKQTKQNLDQAFKEIDRVLKKDGTFILQENLPTPVIKIFYDLLFPLGFRLFNFFGKPLPYFFTQTEIEKFLRSRNLKVVKLHVIRWPKRVYLPVFPLISPPGWLWEQLLRNRIFIVQKAK